MFRIRNVLILIRIRGPIPLDYGPGSCCFPVFSKDFQDSNKKCFLLIYLWVHLHESSKAKSYQEVTKLYKIKVFPNFLLDDERIRNQFRKNNNRSGRSKNIRIRTLLISYWYRTNHVTNQWAFAGFHSCYVMSPLKSDASFKKNQAVTSYISQLFHS